ncbi:MAG: hypothetical protein PHS78_05515 [Aliarcobacter skirrowii]|uniref:hypothetical protein n=1 Tax=Aliarcobacter skirrowii TaxID=28200 RepID=UPI00242BC3D4|nr:hypothetical protein [Aliarcobacter skirrowii]MDD2508478.1 hypothetical protein [Aliarcobacter skirrowii]MDD3497317.1 hypothetical protein [Aliarcobacter skirrowii]
MAMNEIITLNDFGSELKMIKVSLNLDKQIYLLHVFQENYNLNKKFIRSELVLIENEIFTSTFADTVHFMEELNLFDTGNNQNKYLDITEYKNTKNLKLKTNTDKNIFISKSEAKAIYKLFNMAFQGYSVATVLEKEFRVTPQILTKLLHDNNLLDR